MFSSPSWISVKKRSALAVKLGVISFQILALFSLQVPIYLPTYLYMHKSKMPCRSLNSSYANSIFFFFYLIIHPGKRNLKQLTSYNFNLFSPSVFSFPSRSSDINIFFFKKDSPTSKSPQLQTAWKGRQIELSKVYLAIYLLQLVSILHHRAGKVGENMRENQHE